MVGANNKLHLIYHQLSSSHCKSSKPQLSLAVQVLEENVSDDDDTTYAPQVEASSADESSDGEKDQNLNVSKGIAKIALNNMACMLMITIITFFVLQKLLKVSLLKEITKYCLHSSALINIFI